MQGNLSSSRALTLAALFAAQIAGGPPRGDSMSGLIVGQVVDGESGRPLLGAVVAIGGPPGRRGVSPPRVLTGSDGRFVFRGLRRGNYTLTAFKAGFADGAHGRTRPAGPSVPLSLDDGQRTGDALIRLWKHASISGTILDESGERLIGVRVQAYRRAVITGRRRYVPAGTGATDDRGVYRISGLIPGHYIVGAVTRQVMVPGSIAQEIGQGTPLRGAAASEIGLASQGSSLQMIPLGDAAYVVGGGVPVPPPPGQGRLAIYPATFHPAAPAGDAASVIALRPGEEHLSADMQLAPVATVSLSGHVVGPDGPVNTTALRLVAANTAEIARESDSLATMTDRNGRFTFPAVPSGHYTLRLLRGALPQPPRLEPALNTVVWADTPVSLGVEDIHGLVVEALPGIRIGGRIEFEGSGATRQPAPANIEITIEAADAIPGTAGRAASARVDSRGEFRSAPLPGGRYYVRIVNSPAGWMFKSAVNEGRDVADTPLTLAADTLGVVITFTDRWSGVRGSVQNRQGPDPAAAVIVFPTDSDTWESSGLNPRRVRIVRPSRTGEYSLNVPPGDYYVIAVRDEQAADWQDPSFLEAASRAAARVVIREGERKVQELLTRELR